MNRLHRYADDKVLKSRELIETQMSAVQGGGIALLLGLGPGFDFDEEGLSRWGVEQWE